MASERIGRPRYDPEGPEEVMGMLREMAADMREQATATNRMMERMKQRNKENSEGYNGGAEVDLEYLKFAEFRKANPPSFRGAYNRDRADEWIKAMKKIFSVGLHRGVENSFCYLYARSRCCVLVGGHQEAVGRHSDPHHVEEFQDALLQEVLSHFREECEGAGVHEFASRDHKCC